MRVLYMTNIPVPYRVAFFNELGKYCDLTVTFERKRAADRNNEWLSNSFQNFKGVFLQGYSKGAEQAFCPAIAPYLSRKKFDAFIVGGYSTPTGMLAIEILRAKRIPFWMNSDGGLIKSDNKVRYAIKRHFIASAASWLSTGKQTTEYLVHYGADRKRVYTYPFTSVSEQQILERSPTLEEKNTLRKELSIKEQKMVVSVGRYIPIKGFDVLMRSAQKLPQEVGVYIIGGNPGDDYLQMQQELQVRNIHFVDFMPMEQLAKYYQAADVFVLPTRGDVWGLVVNEAMANGLPVITTDRCVAGLELVRQGENGYIVPVEDANALAEAIKTFYKSDSVKMSKNALQTIRDYTIEKMAEAHTDILSELVHAK